MSLPPPRIDADFPAGNVIVEGVAGDTVRLRQDLRDTEGHWFYWAFRVRGAEGRRRTFEFTNGDVIGALGPAVSTDEGATWRWLGRAACGDRSFAYAFGPAEHSVRFAVGIPYLAADLAAFAARHAGNPALRVERLCASRKGRDVERVLAGCLGREPAWRVALAARHHACEAMADYALEGFLEAVLAADGLGAWYRERVEVLAVPFADKDGVEDGDPGKNRRPRDHGRDYLGESLYPETRAIREFLPAWSGGKLAFAADLHCPYLKGGRHNEVVYQVGKDLPGAWTEQQRFGSVLERVRRGPVPYRAADDLPFGVDWNTGKNYGTGIGFTRWAGTLPGVRLATSFEIPYASASAVEVNPASARLLGRDLAAAVRVWLGAA